MDDKQPTNEELAKIERLMGDAAVAHAAGLVLAAWRLYWLARAQMISVSRGQINEQNFQLVSQALSKEACSGFKVGLFKNQVKNAVMPFLKRLAMKEAKVEMPNGHGPTGDPRSSDGDETSCHP